MMSVISAQSTARKLPAPTPTRIAPTTRTGGDGASAAIVMPNGPDRAGAVDDPLASDAIATGARPGCVATAVHSAATSDR